MKSFKKFLIENEEIIHQEAHHARDFLDWLHKKHYEQDTDYEYPGIAPSATMDGHCAIASMLLTHRLHKRGLHPNLVVGKVRGEWGEHSWVEHGNKIIDITKTQYSFKFPKVAIFDKGSEEGKKYYVPVTFKRKTNFRVAKSILSGWLLDQKLHKKLREKMKLEYQNFIKEKRNEE